MKWVSKGNEFNEMGQLISQSTDTYLIWGAGVHGEHLFHGYAQNVKIEGFIDSNPEKQDTIFCGVPVYAPDYLHGKAEVFSVIVASGWTKEINSYLLAENYKKNVNFFHMDDFVTLYEMFHNDQLHLSNLLFEITDYCTLNCKHCGALVPYIENKKNIPMESLLAQLEASLQWFDVIQTLGLTGGDAMVHPDFFIILKEIIKRYYNKRIKKIEIYTNAVIMPTEEMLDLWKEYDVVIRFTNYGEYVKEKQKPDVLIPLLKEKNIRYDYVQFTSWIKPYFPKKDKNLTDPAELINFFHVCDKRSCVSLYDGKIFLCNAIYYYQKIDGYCDMENNDYFDISFYDRDRRKELMEYILGYSEKGYYNACSHCYGSANINQQEIPVGEQVEKRRI